VKWRRLRLTFLRHGRSSSWSAGRLPELRLCSNELEPSLSDADGQRVLIDRAALSFRQPRRWEVVAFRQSRQPGRMLVKRWSDLPGESIEINGGDVYIDGASATQESGGTAGRGRPRTRRRLRADAATGTAAALAARTPREQLDLNRLVASAMPPGGTTSRSTGSAITIGSG